MSTKKKDKKGIHAGETQHFLKMVNETVPAAWKGQKFSAERPDQGWTMEHVYGFSAHNKGCLFFGKDNNEVIYPIAALGVVMNLETNEQKYFGGCELTKNQEKYVNNWPCHQDDITNIDVLFNNGQGIAVTGECGAKSTIHVWDTTTLKSLNQYSLGGTAKGVAALALSPCQRYIAVCDQSNDHNMSIFHTSKKKAIVSISAGTDAVSDIKWSRKPNDLRFVAITSRSLQFWNPADSSKKLFKNGAFGPNFNQTKFTSCTFDEEGVAYSGGANGAVHCWDQRGELGLVLKAHAGECTAVVCKEKTLVSAGKDYKLCIHTADKGTFEFVKQISLLTHYQASALDLMNGKVAIGHDNGRIATCVIDSEEQAVHGISHFDGEVWGLEVMPEMGTFITSGDDNQFMEVNIKDKKVLRTGHVWIPEYNNGMAYETKKIRSTASTLCSFSAHQQARAITYSSTHNHLALSNNHGDISIFHYDDFSQPIHKMKHPQEWVEAMEYSPDSKFLAVGAHDDTIYIYKISDDGKYTLHYKIEYMHSSAITALDWSRDSKYLRAIDQAYSKLYYDITECVHIKDGASVLTDPVIWETATCKLGWEVAGVFPAGADGTDINAVDSNADRSLVAAADDFGTLCLYRFPVMSIKNDCVRLGGHSSHVTRVRWVENGNPADTRIITAGGNDRAFIQWKAFDRPAEDQE